MNFLLIEGWTHCFTNLFSQFPWGSWKKKQKTRDFTQFFALTFERSLTKETMTFLMDIVLEADLHSETFAITPSFMQIYSYLHDRCRAVRVDLHLQQPWSSQTAAFVTCHEYCLRFEIFARFLFAKDAKNGKGGCGNDGRDLLNNFTH